MERGLSSRTIRYTNVVKSSLKHACLPPLRLYDLRHTAATIAVAVGVSPKVASEQRGHAGTAFTLDTHAHVLPHMQDEAVAYASEIYRAELPGLENGLASCSPMDLLSAR